MGKYLWKLINFLGAKIILWPLFFSSYLGLIA